MGVAPTLWIDVMAGAAVEGAAIAERLLRWALPGCTAELQGEQLMQQPNGQDAEPEALSTHGRCITNLKSCRCATAKRDTSRRFLVPAVIGQLRARRNHKSTEFSRQEVRARVRREEGMVIVQAARTVLSRRILRPVSKSQSCFEITKLVQLR